MTLQPAVDALPQFELDADYYRLTNSDLEGTDRDLERHFLNHGLNEGRPGSEFCFRANFVSLIPEGRTLEIGPFDGPLVSGPQVEYLDVLEAKALRERAARLARNVEGVPARIHHVVGAGETPEFATPFDSLASCHLLEHVPCLVRHLAWAERSLAPRGRYFLVLPDKRFCFDHFLPATSIAEVLQAELDGRTTHSLASLVEHRCLVTHNDAGRHWAGDHGATRLVEQGVAVLEEAIREFTESEGAYLDVHAWKFTPQSFCEILQALNLLGKSNLVVSRIFNTPRNHLEFCVVLERASREMRQALSAT